MHSAMYSSPSLRFFKMFIESRQGARGSDGAAGLKGFKGRPVSTDLAFQSLCFPFIRLISRTGKNNP